VLVIASWLVKRKRAVALPREGVSLRGDVSMAIRSGTEQNPRFNLQIPHSGEGEAALYEAEGNRAGTARMRICEA
jgi:hypothetical protein